MLRDARIRASIIWGTMLELFLALQYGLVRVLMTLLVSAILIVIPEFF
jgi:hypothetical protein